MRSGWCATDTYLALKGMHTPGWGTAQMVAHESGMSVSTARKYLDELVSSGEATTGTMVSRAYGRPVTIRFWKLLPDT